MKVKVNFWRKNSWPWSIDKNIVDAKMDTIEVNESELFEKNGIKYYRMVIGHGQYEDLLVK